MWAYDWNNLKLTLSSEELSKLVIKTEYKLDTITISDFKYFRDKMNLLPQQIADIYGTTIDILNGVVIEKFKINLIKRKYNYKNEISDEYINLVVDLYKKLGSVTKASEELNKPLAFISYILREKGIN